MPEVSDVLLIAVALIVYTTNMVIETVLAILKHRYECRCTKNNAKATKVLLRVAVPILQRYLADDGNGHGKPQQGCAWKQPTPSKLPSFLNKGEKEVPSVYAEQVLECNDREQEEVAKDDYDQFIRRMTVEHDAVKGDD